MAQFTLPPVYPILDTVTLDRLHLGWVAAAEALIDGGAAILQIRHKAFWSRDTFAQAERIARICRLAGVLFVVNDRADYAAVLNADGAATVGLHVGQEDLSPVDARLVIGEAAILGYSTHSAEQVREVVKLESPITAREADVGAGRGPEGPPRIDYLAFGPVFPTASKDRPDPTVGIAGLKAVRSLTRKPLVAIGGITRDNAFTCWNAGAGSVAVIADLYPNPCTQKTLRDRMTEWQNLTAS